MMGSFVVMNSWRKVSVGRVLLVFLDELRVPLFQRVLFGAQL